LGEKKAGYLLIMARHTHAKSPVTQDGAQSCRLQLKTNGRS
jgi:hypothetical protein